MSIERKFLQQTARMLGVFACAAALCLSACISPDLEPPGAAGTGIPARPGGPAAAAMDSAGKPAGTVTSQPSTTANPNGDASITIPPTMMMAPGATTPAVGAAGAGAAPNSGGAAPQQPSGAMSPPTNTAGTAGAAGSSSESTKDADAGVDTP